MAVVRRQVLLLLACLVFVESHLVLKTPFITLGSEDPANIDIGPINDNRRHPGMWIPGFEGLPKPHNLRDRNIMTYDKYHGHRPFGLYNPYDGSLDPYFGLGPFGMDNFDSMPGIHNVFNIPDFHLNNDRPPAHPEPLDHKDGDDKNSKENVPADKPSSLQDNDPKDHKFSLADFYLNQGKPVGDSSVQQHQGDHKEVDNELPKETVPLDKPATTQEGDPKPSEETPLNTENNEELPPKTNENKKENPPEDNNKEKDEKDGKKDDKDVDVNKKKDYLLVGSGNNGNNVFLLHENTPPPNPVVVPNNNQPNLMYVAYNPGQPNNQVYQVVNGQPASIPTNTQVSPDKMNVNFNNGQVNSGQPANQDDNHVLVYYNGQIIKIPGYIVTQAQNNGNPVQGSNVIIANAMPSVQNPGSNVYYAAVPNGQVVCSTGTLGLNPSQDVTSVPNVFVNSGIPSNSGNQPQTVTIQPAVLFPSSSSSSASNEYFQPDVFNSGQGTNAQVFVPTQGASYTGQSMFMKPSPNFSVGYNGYNQPIMVNQGTPINSQNIPEQPTSALPVNNPSNPYSQPISNQGTPNNGQNMPVSSNPVNSASNEYNQPIFSIQENPNNNQNMPLASALPVNNAANEFNQPNEENQATNEGNDATHDSISDETETPVAVPAAAVPNGAAVVLGNNNLSNLGAQPAVMLSAFKETPEAPKGKKKRKVKKIKKKKGKKNNDAGLKTNAHN